MYKKATYFSSITTLDLTRLGKIIVSAAFFCNLGSTAWAQCAPDVTPPVITCPSNITVNSDFGLCNAMVTYGAPVYTDNCAVLQTQTFAFTGAMQTFTVPAGVTSVTIETWGAQGNGGNGGLGGYVKGDLTVTPGQVLNIYVGGQNGFNGGGNGYAALPRNGGGASDVRVGGTGLNDRVIVAGAGGGGGQTDVGIRVGGHGGGGTVGANYVGGGGGEGYGANGGPGGVVGGTGNTSCHSGGAGGGGFTSGGAPSCNTCYTSTCGTPGSLGTGGHSDTWETGICFTTYGGTNGGGGGYYGGGGSSVGNCGGGGGGGGSSYSGSLTNTIFTGGIRLGNGQVAISYIEAPVTLTQLAGQTSGSAFATGTNSQTFEAEDGSGNTATCTFDIIVIDAQAPVADAGSLADINACTSASPTPPTATDNCAGAINGVPDVTMPIVVAGTTVVTWTFSDGAGNSITQTQNVNVEVTDVSVAVTPPMTISANNSTAISYQWIDCANGNSHITGETSASYTATSDGSYAVIITDGSCTDTSACIVINTSGIATNDLNGVTVYPSPTSGNYTIQLDQVYDQIFVKIIDASGRVLDEYSVSQTSKINSSFDGSKGVYVIQINAGGKSLSTPLVVE
jgi:hypothetical protein